MKKGGGLGLGSSSKFWGSPIIFVQRPRFFLALVELRFTSFCYTAVHGRGLSPLASEKLHPTFHFPSFHFLPHFNLFTALVPYVLSRIKNVHDNCKYSQYGKIIENRYEREVLVSADA